MSNVGSAAAIMDEGRIVGSVIDRPEGGIAVETLRPSSQEVHLRGIIDGLGLPYTPRNEWCVSSQFA